MELGDQDIDMNVVPEELTEGAVDVSADQDGGVKKVISLYFQSRFLTKNQNDNYVCAGIYLFKRL